MSKISLNMVQEMTIDHSCFKIIPCLHNVNITLTDGREKSVKLYAPTVQALINKLPREKIKQDDQALQALVEHFSFFASDHWKEFNHENDNLLERLFEEGEKKATGNRFLGIIKQCTQKFFRNCQ